MRRLAGEALEAIAEGALIAETEFQGDLTDACAANGQFVNGGVDAARDDILLDRLAEDPAEISLELALGIAGQPGDFPHYQRFSQMGANVISGITDRPEMRIPLFPDVQILQNRDYPDDLAIAIPQRIFVGGEFGREVFAREFPQHFVFVAVAHALDRLRTDRDYPAEMILHDVKKPGNPIERPQDLADGDIRLKRACRGRI